MHRVRTFCAKSCQLGLLLLGSLAIYACDVAASANAQDLEYLRQSVRTHLLTHYENQYETVEIEVNRLDPRLRLEDCKDQLAFSIRDLSNNGGAVSVKTECRSHSPWTVYIGAQIKVFEEVVVARRALSRGDIIQPSDLTHKKMNSSELRNGYFLDVQAALGKEVRRNLDAGEIMRDGVLNIPLAINRGDIITLASSNGAITVNTRAEALSNGRVGEQIRVRNLTSERIIVANIVKSGVVEVKY
ncbi:flagellar basal body P-ring formation chaperone FlgA [Gilvimarinus sp. SDUM040013]|uniref:Flagella basal body P-ring formation protein FlgA n=1 Tax=Gilvimarinus gilvus TaxID=3058038 RepID=A0ABU4RXT1_9GAMM|nr:flagellar basal body P-ring formation chaperone FlgA [Gilvimarinus sp. SDUM040013]MDO3385088.1 flagellar basal body P-ring formation chaperone FlgA [Gilvimarinus sp. SDUM040013]MDX6848463.1 flagellar basal body P-ring formation chaperone FlgA [Gilvimarinus sp. SDUM040013]